MAGRTLSEITEALTSVRAAIKTAETAQRYQTVHGQEKEMAHLRTLYDRENQLLAERDRAGRTTPARNYGVYRR